MPNPSRGAAFVLIVGLLLLLFLGPSLMRQAPSEVAYSDFIAHIQQGQVKAVTIAGNQAVARYQDDKVRQVTIPGGDPRLLAILDAKQVAVEFAASGGRPWWSMLLSGLLPVGILVFFLWFMMRQSQGGQGQVFQFGQSRARQVASDGKKVTMNDVAGMPEVKEELQEVIDFLKHPERYRELGARIPKGILLAGPPGTGKTLLARAVAGEAGVPFFTTSGSDFVELFAGVGASRVRDMFEKAKKSSPCIIFVDEIDAVGRHRGMGVGGGNDEREQTLNQLLVELDGFGPNEGIIVIGATNRVDVLDPALLRAGRFDRQIQVDPPDRRGRREILAVHAAGKPMADDVDLDSIAGRTSGFTGADLANLLNEAALLAARRRHLNIAMDDIESAYDRVIAGGPAKKRQMSQAERERVAYHEAGHAIVSLQMPESEAIRKVTIIGAGGALGYVQYETNDDKFLHSRTDIVDRIVRLLGGRAAEEVVLGEVSTGAGNDLERATSLARRMVTELGMDDTLGPVRLGNPAPENPLFGMQSGRTVSEQTAHEVDQAVHRLIGSAYERARNLVTENRAGLEKIARTLLERETIKGEELPALIAS